jgi:hypothetical protein
MFKVGSNQVIRGWDEAVRDMATGTSLDFFFKNLIFNPILLITVPQATVAIESAWAYGKKGVPEVFFCFIFFFVFHFAWAYGN